MYTLKSCIISVVHPDVHIVSYFVHILQEWLQTVLNTVYQK
jgi:hypothetical protein|uniref:Uncharacterized protein n=1 Tax=Podoviridae sp. ctsNK10 TaxID=2826582 RepID=A0A8S5NLH8_9CAUD|nr:MAG TPA: hypothetical protein [Podoviridae sp. ctsNK10]